jgi:hypothetical protein
MSEIKRYDSVLIYEWGDVRAVMEPDFDGEYVKYDDIKHLLTSPVQDKPKLGRVGFMIWCGENMLDLNTCLKIADKIFGTSHNNKE